MEDLYLNKLLKVKYRCIDFIDKELKESGIKDYLKLANKIVDIVQECMNKYEKILCNMKKHRFKFLKAWRIYSFSLRPKIKQNNNNSILNNFDGNNKSKNETSKYKVEHSIYFEINGIIVNKEDGNDNDFGINNDNEEEYDNVLGLDNGEEENFFNPRRKHFILSTDSEIKLKIIVNAISIRPNKEFIKCRKDLLSKAPKITFWVYMKFLKRETLNNRFACSCIYELNTYNIYSIESFFYSKGDEYNLDNLKNI